MLWNCKLCCIRGNDSHGEEDDSKRGEGCAFVRRVRTAPTKKRRTERKTINLVPHAEGIMFLMCERCLSKIASTGLKYAHVHISLPGICELA